MAVEIGIARPSAASKAILLGSSMAGGLINGAIMKRSPVLGFATTIGTALVGTVGSMFTKGAIAEVLGGMGAGAVGAFGLLIPMMTASRVSVGRGFPERTAETAMETAEAMRSLVGSRRGVGVIKPEFKTVELT